MRKLSVSTLATLDGVIQDPGGFPSWLTIEGSGVTHPADLPVL